MKNESKIRSEHLSRNAYVYVRQSSPGQVLLNTESARRQRDLVGLAEALGWPPSRIHLLDGDQGRSGQVATGREAYKEMVGAVSVGEVGIIIGLEISRVGRNAAEWFPLIEVCALTGTLVADEQGVYDPNDPNDRLILGVKVTISEAELTSIRSRLQGARWSRARRGELRRNIPVGYVWDERGRVVMDPDERVRSAICSFFRRFREIGTALGVARVWNQDGLLFPRKSYRARWDAAAEWKPLGARHANHVLHNPFYAGTYYYGARRSKTSLDPQTRARKTRMEPLPLEEWEVLIRGAHEGYISWEEFLRNQERLRENWNMPGTGPGSPRSGAALLAGIAYCSRCGHRMGVRYTGRRTHPAYACQTSERSGESRYCMLVMAARVDRWVEEKILEAIEPLGIEAALGAVEELKRRSEDLRRQWRNRIDQAEYEAALARRRYEAVDPANRLVAGNLERGWEEKLAEVERLKKEYEDRSGLAPMQVSEEDLRRVRELARDLPRLWRSKKTKASDRKKIVRILVRDVWLSQEDEPRRTRVRIHWQTGAITEGEVERPLPPALEQKTPEEVIARVRELNDELKDPREIAEQLTREGRRTSKGTPYTPSGISYLLKSRNIIPAAKREKRSSK